MANTTNFNWETPDDTDLVKDGAAAIRTLGSAIDTSLVDLKGGTTGQVLSKATNTDMDFTWVAQDDSNAIQNAIIDAKGDLIVGTAADTPARLAVGTNGYILTADSTQSAGIKWAAAASGSTFVGANITNSSDQSISNGTWTTIAFNSEQFDTDAFHDNSTNNTRMTIPAGKGGYYLITTAIQFGSNDTGFRATVLRKNGSDYQNLNWVDADSGNNIWTSGSATISCVATDYLEIAVYQNSGGALDAKAGCNFTISYLGA